MTWARLDDRANEHRKQLEAGPEACWLWACGLMYANRQDARDGFIPERALQILYPFADSSALASKLVEVGLWKKVKGGYSIHQFTVWNQSKEQRESERSSGRIRAAKSYNLRAKSSDSSGEDKPKSQTEEPAILRGSSGVGVEGDLSSGSLTDQSKEKPDPEDVAVQELFEFWRTNTANQNCKLTPTRRSSLRSRLRDGFTLEQLKQVVLNSKSHPDYNGSKGTVYDGVENLFRSIERVDKLLKVSPASGVHRVAAPVAPTADAVAAHRAAEAALVAKARAQMAERSAARPKQSELPLVPPNASTVAS